MNNQHEPITGIMAGQLAPDFSLLNTNNIPVSLSDFTGQKNVLLLFFPKAFTNTCTRELCSVRDDISRYENADTQVIAISVDPTSTLADYKKDQQLNYELLSDADKQVSILYNSIYYSPDDKALPTVSKRSAFLIDKQGIIQYSEILEDAYQIPDFTAINNILQRLSK